MQGLRAKLQAARQSDPPNAQRTAEIDGVFQETMAEIANIIVRVEDVWEHGVALRRVQRDLSRVLLAAVLSIAALLFSYVPGVLVLYVVCVCPLLAPALMRHWDKVEGSMPWQKLRALSQEPRVLQVKGWAGRATDVVVGRVSSAIGPTLAGVAREVGDEVAAKRAKKGQ